MKERKLSVADVKATVEEVYNEMKDIPVDGSVDPRTPDADESKFGIAVVMTDGTVFEIGDTEIKAPLGSIAKIGLAAELRSQREGRKKECKETGDCCCKRNRKEMEGQKPENMPVSVHGIRLMSRIEPIGDPEGKWNAVMNPLTSMMGSAPELNDDLYQSMSKTNAAADVENAMAKNEFYLYDDAPIAIDLYTKLSAMCASSRQLAELGATLANGGVNPVSGEAVYDSTVTPRVIATMAVKGPHKMSLHWLSRTGLPAKTSFGGTMVAVLPGVLGIAAYSPTLNDAGISIRSAKAIKKIAKRLDLNAFTGENIVIEK